MSKLFFCLYCSIETKEAPIYKQAAPLREKNTVSSFPFLSCQFLLSHFELTMILVEWKESMVCRSGGAMFIYTIVGPLKSIHVADLWLQ